MKEIFIHETAHVHPEAKIGEGTEIWQNVVVTSAASVGSECVIGANSFIDGIIGDRCKIANGVCVFQGVELEDDVFVSHGVSFANVTIPRAYRPIDRSMFKKTIVKQGATIEINATIAPGITIGWGAIVGMGSVVLDNVPPKTLARGNPAQVSLKSIKHQRKYEDKEQPQA